jgi:DNA-directed RNA polymerase specialized sigma24 family protein
MAGFPSTQWTLLNHIAAEDPRRRAAWQELALRYRPAIRRYLAWALGAQDADDHVQEFLLRSLRDDWWTRAERERGHFRGFLRLLLDRYIGHAREHQRVRGPVLELDAERLVSDAQQADALYDRAFVAALTARALDVLDADYARRGRGEVFAALKPLLLDAGHGDQKAVAAALGLSPNAVAAALLRLRRALVQAMRAELACLIADPDDLDREWQDLGQSLGASSLPDPP